MPATKARVAQRKAALAPAHKRVSYSADPRKVLLALDGSRASNAAARLARRLAQLNVWSPDAITVTQPAPTYIGDYLLPAPPIAQDVIQGNVMLHLRTQLRRHGLPSWPASVRFGPTGLSILETAAELGATLIVMGLGKHGRLARLFGAETANRVARKSDVPVLAVHAKMRSLPRVVVAAVDFGEASNRAVVEAMQIMEPGGQLHLVHVMSPYNFTPVANGAWRLSYEEAVESSFARMRQLIEPDIAIKTTLLTGGVADEVVKYARKVKADLITAGTHNQGVVERMLLGSAAADLLRHAPCSVLVAPPPASTAGA